MPDWEDICNKAAAHFMPCCWATERMNGKWPKGKIHLEYRGRQLSWKPSPTATDCDEPRNRLSQRDVERQCVMDDALPDRCAMVKHCAWLSVATKISSDPSFRWRISWKRRPMC